MRPLHGLQVAHPLIQGGEVVDTNEIHTIVIELYLVWVLSRLVGTTGAVAVEHFITFHLFHHQLHLVTIPFSACASITGLSTSSRSLRLRLSPRARCLDKVSFAFPLALKLNNFIV